LINKYGKPSGPLLKLKQNFIDDNHLLLEQEREIYDIYTEQPIRSKCKNCDYVLEAQSFVKQTVAYSICNRCGHLNGLHQDSGEFCKAVYTDDDGEYYARAYKYKDKKDYFSRVKDIYHPKADFLLKSLSVIGELPESLQYSDIGAGSGYFGCALNPSNVNKIIGYEVSKFQVTMGNDMIGKDLLIQHSLEETIDLAQAIDSDVVSMIGVLEHLQEPRKILEALRNNPNVRYLYFSVPMFSITVFFEMVFSEVWQRHLNSEHTHLYTEQSLKWLANEFGMQQVSAWWFGTDMVDLYRNINVELKKDSSTNDIIDTWEKMFIPLIDNLQLVIDKSHLASEVHMLYKFNK
jgi:hypothetical protein